MGTITKTQSFEGFKGEIFNKIKEAGDKGITYKELKDKFVSKLLDEARAVGGDSPNLHATLQILTNGKHVNTDSVHSVVFKDSDVFRVLS